MIKLSAGDIVLVDLGYAAKVRPCLVIAPTPDSRRNMSVFAPVTTEARGGETEIPFPKPAWMRQSSVINLVGMFGYDNAKVERFLGRLPVPVMDKVLNGIAKMLDL
jgi:mRNA interferase MazF